MALEMWLTAIQPGRWSLQPVIAELLKELDALGKEAKKLLLKPTATWTHKVTFHHRVDRATARVRIWTTDRIYGYLDRGTKPHVIEPRRPLSPSGRPSSLRYQAGYRPKTRPRRLSSYHGGKLGPFIYPVGVMHPGIAARGFTTLVAKRMQQLAPRKVGTAIQRGVTKGIGGVTLVSKKPCPPTAGQMPASVRKLLSMRVGAAVVP